MHLDLGPLPLDLWALLVWLAVALPVLGRRRFLRLQAAAEADLPALKLRSYRLALVMQAVHAAVAVLAIRRLGVPLAAAGIPGPHPLEWLWYGAFFVAATGFFAHVRLRNALRRGRRPAAAQGVERLRRILPATARERRVFVFVALGAGVSEELLYRAFLIHAAYRFGLGPFAAGAAAAGIFGCAHIYQGARGVVTTTLVGAAMALLYLTTKSLVAPIVAHAALDLVSGLVIARFFLDESPQGPAQDPRA